MNPEFGPDLDLLQRRPYIQDGMPPIDEDDPDTTKVDPLLRVQREQEEQRTNVHPDDNLYREFQKSHQAGIPTMGVAYQRSATTSTYW